MCFSITALHVQSCVLFLTVYTQYCVYSSVLVLCMSSVPCTYLTAYLQSCVSCFVLSVPCSSTSVVIFLFWPCN